MSDQVLQEARSFEELEEKKISQEDRPVYHLTPRVGWMNDPNGFSYYKGEYHLFYQYNPYGQNWGPMHWGHAVSKDLFNWKYLPVILAPDEAYDYAGCFSGSAITLEDQSHLLMYTGVAKEKDERGVERDIQTQCIAVGDGTNYTKYEHNPVIDRRMLPEGASISDFRDPHIFKAKDGRYKSIVANRGADGYGCLLLFRSDDGFKWEFEKELVKNVNGYCGMMWECPDYFELDGKKVIVLSPQEMEAKNLEFHNGNGTVFMICDQKENDDFDVDTMHAIDYGIDFYAPQTIETPDGRRVMIGWMQNWDGCVYRKNNCLWYGQMTSPRELHIENNRIYQLPIREIEVLRSDKVEYKDVVLEGEVSLEGIEGRVADIELELEPISLDNIYKEFEMKIASNGKNYIDFSYRPSEGIAKIDRKYSGSRNGIVHQRRCELDSKGGKLKARILLDKYSAEFFLNDGEKAMTVTFYTEQSAKDIIFKADGAKINITKYTLKK